MEIIITQWALDSYLELKHAEAFSVTEYKKTIRPDVLLLKDFPGDPKFSNSKFWSIATDKAGNKIPDGFKMKWHHIGNGKVQLRLPIGIINDEANLCGAYVKNDPKQEARMMAKFKTYLELIRLNRFTEHGRLV